MGSLFNTIISTIKNRFAAITSAISTWTNRGFIKTQIIDRFRRWLTRIFNVKPRHKKDYCGIFGLLVSKRLVHTVVIVIGLVCLAYLWTVKPFKTESSDAEQIKVYNYNSIPLRFANKKVSIKAKKGYIAYTGQVKGGHAEGSGELYNEDGGLVYVGEFSDSMYNGTGTSYYPSGQVCYEGTFVDNLYDGTGVLYRDSGAMHYSGEFDDGYMDGQGELYNTKGTLVFTGLFSRDEIEYTQFLNKSSAEINEMYTGTQTLYSDGDENIIALDDIDALYVAEGADTSIDDENTSTSVYVMNSVFVQGDTRIETIEDLKKALGEPEYEGNSYINFYDAVAIQWGIDSGDEINIDPVLEYTQEYDEYIDVTSYDSDALLYMYVFEVDDLSYTFISEGANDSFFMYIIAG